MMGLVRVSVAIGSLLGTFHANPASEVGQGRQEPAVAPDHLATQQHRVLRWNQMYKWPSKSRDLSNLTWPVSRYWQLSALP